MAKEDHIGEVARLLGMTPSTLRYWGDQGLLRFGRDEANNYRKASMSTMWDIIEIKLYRDLGLPVKRLKTIFREEPSSVREALEESREGIRGKLAALERTLARADEKIGEINRVEELAAKGLKREELRLGRLAVFRFADRRMVELYKENPQCSCAFFRAGDYTAVRYGILTKEGGERLRGGDARPMPYITGLLKINAEKTRENSADEFLREAERLGARPGALIGRYLLSAGKTRRWDFYEARLECLDV